MKIFGIGLNKTGTSSLGRFFQNNGLKMHEDYSLMKIQLAKSLIAGDNDKAELILDIVENADVFEDWPWPLIYKQCLERYPESKFILTVRDSPEEWFDSLYHHCRRLGPTKQIKAIYGHYTPNKKTMKDFIEYYIKHNKDVVEFFSDKPGKLLVLPTSMDNSKKGEVIAKFIGLKVADLKFPTANKRKSVGDVASVLTITSATDYPEVYRNDICQLLFETQDFITQSYVNYSLLDIMIANLNKSNIDEEYKKKSPSFDMFIKLAIRFAMQLGYRQAVMYFVKKYNFDVDTPVDLNGNSIRDFAKKKDKKLLNLLTTP